MENTMKKLGTSANGIDVFAHPEGHSHRPDLDEEVISKINLPENNTFFRTTVDMGRVIGKDHLVEIEPDSICFYWKRGNRPGESYMVLQEADDTQYVTAIFCVCRDEEGTPAELVGQWILITLFEGCPGEREPFDRSFEKKFEDEKVAEAFRRSLDFWKTHALVPTKKEMEEIRGHRGWSFATYEEGEVYDHEHDSFDECIANYNTAKSLIGKEWWMEAVDEPSPVN